VPKVTRGWQMVRRSEFKRKQSIQTYGIWILAGHFLYVLLLRRKCCGNKYKMPLVNFNYSDVRKTISKVRRVGLPASLYNPPTTKRPSNISYKLSSLLRYLLQNGLCGMYKKIHSCIESMLSNIPPRIEEDRHMRAFFAHTNFKCKESGANCSLSCFLPSA
jgi:hypothetical protein